jgi:hypothetical protein
MSARLNRRGSGLLEAAMVTPIIVLLLTGMVTIGRITYTYYTLRKTVYSIARYVGTQQGVNFCSATDPAIVAAINFGLTGTTDGTQTPFVSGLTPDMFQITAELYDPVGQTISACSCGLPGCDPTQGGSAPDFIVVSIPNGYQAPVRILGLNIDPVLLRPEVKVPYGGT